ncbi:uncharacterized protein LOC129188895, partial [Dunckerocampus dactyliophorus]|uniref:uncharacterized protein LOC129188895 n=1 Tax=Dunckerocampus dactyliophorus TaxID=161453 RepID=UPI002406D55D
LVNELISDHNIDQFCSTETRLNYVNLNESTINFHIPRESGRGGGVAAICHSTLPVNPQPKLHYQTLRTIVLSISHPAQHLRLVIVYHPPGPYSEFLTDLLEFLSNRVICVNKIIIVGDFNIRMDVNNDSLAFSFTSLLDASEFSHVVDEATHCHNHTLDLVLTYGIDVKRLTIFPQNPVLSDHFLIPFEFQIVNYTPVDKTLPSTNTFKDAITPLLNLLPFKEI